MKPGDGSLAELCSVRDEDLVVIDTDLADTAVAALGLSAVAGWMALSWRANLQSGETVLVLGAGGAVGQATIGAAHALGAGRVVALCRSESSCLRAEEAGADRVVRMPTTTDLTGLIDHLRKACAETADVVIDPVFGDAAVAAMAGAGPGWPAGQSGWGRPATRPPSPRRPCAANRRPSSATPTTLCNRSSGRPR